MLLLLDWLSYFLPEMLFTDIFTWQYSYRKSPSMNNLCALTVPISVADFECCLCCYWWYDLDLSWTRTLINCVWTVWAKVIRSTDFNLIREGKITSGCTLSLMERTVFKHSIIVTLSPWFLFQAHGSEPCGPLKLYLYWSS